MEENGVAKDAGAGNGDCINEDQVVCRDYLRNVCARGNRCKFSHPSGLAGSASTDFQDHQRTPNLLHRGNSGNPAGSSLTFCHDYQNTSCSRPSCKFVHGSRQDEEQYKVTGELPKHVLSSAVNRGILFAAVVAAATCDNSNEQLTDIPLCKDYQKGECHRGKKCRFRHVDKNGGTSCYDQQTQSSQLLLHRKDIRDEFDLPDAKRRHYDDFELGSRYLARFYDFNHYYRERPVSPPRQVSAYTIGNVSTGHHHHLPSAANHSEFRVLQEENLLLRCKVDELKKQVSDLMATNEFLLDQNAHLRLQSKIPTASTVTTVTLPAVTIANSVTVPVTTSSVQAFVGPIPTVQTVQTTATLPLVATAQSAANTAIPYAAAATGAPQHLTTVSIAPVTCMNQSGVGTVAPSLSAATAATVTLTPALQLDPNTAISWSGTDCTGPIVSYPIMTQSIIAAPQTLQNSLTR